MRDLVTQNRSLETSGIDTANTATFSVAVNGKTFRLLVDGLYSDKPRAIIREICSNALDAHVMNGNANEPFDVHLPNRMEPFFSCRDYGTGLPHDAVMGLYTTLFQSTKENTNSQVGRFGLGSKTPFGYTEQYGVTSWHGGMKRIYSAFLDTDGVPNITLVVEEESDERTGLEVTFPVENQDCQKFVQAAHYTFVGFDVLPNMTGASKFEYPKPRMEGKEWRIYEQDGLVGNGVKIRQGCVVYPLDTGLINQALEKIRKDDQQAYAKLNDDPDFSISRLLTGLGHTPLIIDMPVGSVDITPSRESLSYDSVTVANICEVLPRVMKEIVAPFKVRIKAKTIHEANALAEKAIENINNAFRYELAEQLRRYVTWRGMRVPRNESIEFQSGREVPDTSPSAKPGDKRHERFKHGSENPRFPGVSLHRLSTSYRRNTVELPGPDTSMRSFSTHDAMNVRKIVLVSWTDLETVKRLRARLQYLRDNVQGINTREIMIALYDPQKKEMLRRLFVRMGRPKTFSFIDVNDLPLPPPVKRDRAAPAKNDVKVMCLNNTDLVQTRNIDFEDGGLFVVAYRNQFESTGSTTDIGKHFAGDTYGDLAGFLHKMYEIGLWKTTEEVTIITRKQYEMVEGNPDWQNLFDTMTDRFAAEYNPKEIEGDVSNLAMRSAFTRRGGVMCASLLLNSDADFKPGRPVYNLLREAIEVGILDKAPENLEILADLGKRFGLVTVPSLMETNVFDYSQRVTALVGAVRKNYPMLRMLWDKTGFPSSLQPHEWAELSAYIKMVDNAAENG